jgi:hypothetical protein
MPNPWVSLIYVQLIPVNKAVNERKQLEKGLKEGERKKHMAALVKRPKCLPVRSFPDEPFRIGVDSRVEEAHLEGGRLLDLRADVARREPGVDSLNPFRPKFTAMCKAGKS